MIRILGDMPPGVLGLEAVDDVEKEDYANIIVPAINEAIARHGKVRLVYVLGPRFDDYEAGAMWEDVKLGVRQAASFERIAIVTNAQLGRSGGQDLQHLVARASARVSTL